MNLGLVFMAGRVEEAILKNWKFVLQKR
jgi:hypothetical protein